MGENQVKTYIRIEGFALALFALLFFTKLDVSIWWLFIGFLIPDISMAGYLHNNKTGAIVYNVGHIMAIPLIVLGCGYLRDNTLATSVGLIWLFHIGIDRTFGYGLKTEKGFQYTNLGKIGK